MLTWLKRYFSLPQKGIVHISSTGVRERYAIWNTTGRQAEDILREKMQSAYIAGYARGASAVAKAARLRLEWVDD